MQNQFFNFSKFSSHNEIRPKASSHREHNVISYRYCVVCVYVQYLFIRNPLVASETDMDLINMCDLVVLLCHFCKQINFI